MNATDSPLTRAKQKVTIADLAAVLFPGWKAGKSCHSPFREDKHPSFSIFADGREWMDHATGEHGDAVDFIAKARGIDKGAAARELIALANTGTVAAPVRPRIETPKPAPAPLQPMPRDLDAIWQEGIEHLRGNLRTQREIEKWRGWPDGMVRQLCEDGLLGCPILNGHRGIAFPVQAPFRDELGCVSTRDLGFHFRRKPSSAEARASWLYRPNEKSDGTSCPALPFVIGGGFIPFAEIVIITEGQWDGLTLCAVSGWLASDAAWPEHITVFATRGAGAWRPLIDSWGRYWPKTARFVLFPDADDAGATWTAPGQFCETLLKLGHRVRIMRSKEPGAKDLNDLHRAQPLTAEAIADWITLKAKTP